MQSWLHRHADYLLEMVQNALGPKISQNQHLQITHSLIPSPDQLSKSQFLEIQQYTMKDWLIVREEVGNRLKHFAKEFGKQNWKKSVLHKVLERQNGASKWWLSFCRDGIKRRIQFLANHRDPRLSHQSIEVKRGTGILYLIKFSEGSICC